MHLDPRLVPFVGDTSFVLLMNGLGMRLPRSLLTPRPHNLSSSLPKLTLLSVAPMHDTVTSVAPMHDTDEVR